MLDKTTTSFVSSSHSGDQIICLTNYYSCNIYLLFNVFMVCVTVVPPSGLTPVLSVAQIHPSFTFIISCLFVSLKVCQSVILSVCQIVCFVLGSTVKW
jgi:hypothetical protein